MVMRKKGEGESKTWNNWNIKFIDYDGEARVLKYWYRWKYICGSFQRICIFVHPVLRFTMPCHTGQSGLAVQETWFFSAVTHTGLVPPLPAYDWTAADWWAHLPATLLSPPCWHMSTAPLVPFPAPRVSSAVKALRLADVKLNSGTYTAKKKVVFF